MEISLSATGNLRVNDDDALAAAVVQGLGLALLPTFLIGGELQSGRLQAALSQYITLGTIHLRCLSREPTRFWKVRAFIDFLLDRFGLELVLG